MARLNVVTARAAVICLGTIGCEGDEALFAPHPILVSDVDEPGTMEPEPQRMPPEPSGSGPPDASSPLPVGVMTPTPSIEPPGDAGTVGMEPDASPTSAAPSTVVVDGPTSELPRLGVVGGDPRLGVCEDGFIIGVRTTANPSLDVFGQRLTFVEPICGKALHRADDVSGGTSGSVSVLRDDALVAWSVTDGFFGLPPTTVPDPSLVWETQPETLCPEATPVVVGFSGEYDPVAPDVVDTAAIRSLFIECAALTVAPNGFDVVAEESGHQIVLHADSFAASGAETYRSACDGGAVTTHVLVHAGFWLDGFVLGCSRLRIDSPDLKN